MCSRTPVWHTQYDPRGDLRWRLDGPVLDSIGMARNSRLGQPGALRFCLAVATWAAAVALAQGILGLDIGEAARRLDERIERKLEGQPAPPAHRPPPRSRDADSIEPWELVSV